jgi:RND family efflux transporter MFP subunit
MRRFITVLGAGLSALLSAAVVAAPTEAPSPASAVTSAVIESRIVSRTWGADATVEAVRQATLAAQVAGRVLEVKVDAGQAVKKGQVLLRIDTREASAGVAAAEARLVEAEAAHKRVKNLRERNFVSAAAVDQSEAQLQSARADAASARAGLSHGVVTAPIDGIVGQRLAEPGDLATPGKPLMTVFDPARLRLVASVPQAHLAAIASAKRARIEFPEQQRLLDAARVEVLPTVDPVSRSGTVRVYLADKVGGVYPGMSVRLHLAVGEGSKLLLPPAAVMRRGEAALVYVLDDKGVARLRQVRLGEASPDGVEVLAGLSSGERVALNPVQVGLAQPRRAD